jgi:hypothetical protein
LRVSDAVIGDGAVQLAPAAMLDPQELVCEKSPLAVTPVMLRATLPVFVSVTL